MVLKQFISYVLKKDDVGMITVPFKQIKSLFNMVIHFGKKLELDQIYQYFHDFTCTYAPSFKNIL